MSLFFDNDLLFDSEGHLTDAGLNALKDGTLDDLGSLEAAEHLSFCDYCLLRYTALIESAPACLQTPMRDLIPQVQALMRMRSFRLMTNRYVSAAAAVVLTFALWQFGLFTPPQTVRVVTPEEPQASVSEILQDAMGQIHSSIYGTFDRFIATAQDGFAQIGRQQNMGE